jgi:hypothetical protein
MNSMFNPLDYDPVEKRLGVKADAKSFWEDYPEGRIETKLLSHSLNQFIVFAAIFRDSADSQPWATGLAEEKESIKGVNSTSALENCETSAIGRALANAGYAPKGKRPSREEMSKVIQNQPKPFSEKLAEKVILPVENDPWTVKAVEPAGTAADAVALVQDVLGATKIDKDIPHCKHGPRQPNKGSKNGREWFNMGCTAKPMNGERWSEVDKCEPIWYQIDKETGQWKPQVARS